MLTKSDMRAVAFVLSMGDEQMQRFIEDLPSNARDYLEILLNKVSKDEKLLQACIESVK